MHNYLFDLLVLTLLLVINGILSLAEMALVSANRNKIEAMAKKSRGAKVALALIDKPGEFLATIQLGITVIGIISGAFSGQQFAEPLGTWLNKAAWIGGYGNIIAFTFVVILVTYITLVLSELIPKRIALSRPEQFAEVFALPVLYLSRLVYPFVFILHYSTSLFMKWLGQQEIKNNSITEAEIHSVIQQGVEAGAIDAFEHKVFKRALHFGDKEVSIMMTPRIKVVSLYIDDSVEENRNKILANTHRYYPVFKREREKEKEEDSFLGIIDTKDVLTQHMKGKNFDLESIIKSAPCVLENNVGPDLLDQLKKYKTHIAMVVDEYGTLKGVVTLVDIFDTLVGEIPESHEEKHYEKFQREDGSWLCDGLTPIDDIEEILDINLLKLIEENDVNTLAGFLLVILKHIPTVGEIATWGDFNFEIVDMDNIRIDKVLISRKIK